MSLSLSQLQRRWELEECVQGGEEAWSTVDLVSPCMSLAKPWGSHHRLPGRGSASSYRLSAYSFICTVGQHALTQYSTTSILYLLSHSATPHTLSSRALWPLFFIYKLQARSFDICCKDRSCAYSLSDDFSPCSVLGTDLNLFFPS